MNNFCYAKFPAYYTIDNKPDEIQDNLIGENYEECGYPKQIKLMKSQTKMQFWRVRRTLQYHEPTNFFSR